MNKKALQELAGILKENGFVAPFKIKIAWDSRYHNPSREKAWDNAQDVRRMVREDREKNRSVKKVDKPVLPPDPLHLVKSTFYDNSNREMVCYRITGNSRPIKDLLKKLHFDYSGSFWYIRGLVNDTVDGLEYWGKDFGGRDGLLDKIEELGVDVSEVRGAAPFNPDVDSYWHKKTDEEK